MAFINLAVQPPPRQFFALIGISALGATYSTSLDESLLLTHKHFLSYGFLSGGTGTRIAI